MFRVRRVRRGDGAAGGGDEFSSFGTSDSVETFLPPRVRFTEDTAGDSSASVVAVTAATFFCLGRLVAVDAGTFSSSSFSSAAAAKFSISALRSSRTVTFLSGDVAGAGVLLVERVDLTGEAATSAAASK